MSSTTKMPIQASLLLATNKTLKDLKGEMLLTFVAQLFDEYMQIRENEDEKKRNVITVKGITTVNGNYCTVGIEKLSHSNKCPRNDFCV